MMNQSEKVSFLLSVVFVGILYLCFHDLRLALLLALGQYVLFFLGGRAHHVSWLVRLDEQEADFRKPPAVRAFFGGIALAVAALALWLPHASPADAASADMLGYYDVFLFGPLVLFFLLGAGPMETRFDLRRGRVVYRLGWPLVARARGQDVSEVAGLRVVAGRKWPSRLYILWRGRRVSGSVFFRTAEEARTAAEHIAGRLGLRVEEQPE